MLWEIVVDTIAQVTEQATVPFGILVAAMRGVKFFGIGGQIGYHHRGLFQADAKRRPGFWCKEIALDLCSLSESRYGPLQTDAAQVPFGNGSARGLVLALGVPQAHMNAVAATLSFDDVNALYMRIWKNPKLRFGTSTMFNGFVASSGSFGWFRHYVCEMHLRHRRRLQTYPMIQQRLLVFLLCCQTRRLMRLAAMKT